MPPPPDRQAGNGMNAVTEEHKTRTRRIVVGITGASGIPYGVRLLEALRDVTGVETHLILTDPAVEVARLGQPPGTLRRPLAAAPGSVRPYAGESH